MEDGHKIVDTLLQHREDRWGYFGVFDGHGGRQEVEYCERRLHEAVLAELRAMPPGTEDDSADVCAALRGAFVKVDHELSLVGAWDSGCTATVALAHRTASALTLHVANVGDARAVVVPCGVAAAASAGGRPKVTRVSKDHRASDPSEAARVKREGGIVMAGRVGGMLAVSRSLGDHHLKSSGVSCVPEVCTCDLGDESALVIATDGLWDAIGDADAGHLIHGCVRRAVEEGGGGTAEAVAQYLHANAARELVEKAKERGSRDNILALVVFL